jgi:hypothetical protein
MRQQGERSRGSAAVTEVSIQERSKDSEDRESRKSSKSSTSSKISKSSESRRRISCNSRRLGATVAAEAVAAAVAIAVGVVGAARRVAETVGTARATRILRVAGASVRSRCATSWYATS